MITLEQKIDLIMQYVVTEDPDLKHDLRVKITDALSDTDSSNTPKPASIDIHHDNDELMSNVIDDLFRELGCPCHLKGYDLAAYAIKLCIHDPEYLRNITCRLYVDVGNAFGTTRSRTERAIRHLVESAWSRHDIRDAYRIFGRTIDINKGKPTNSEFLACCTKIVKRRMRDAM